MKLNRQERNFAKDQSQRVNDARDTSSELLDFTTKRWDFYLNAFRFLRESFRYCFEQPRQRYGCFVFERSERSIDFYKGVIWSLGCNERSNKHVLKIDLFRDISCNYKASLSVTRSMNAGLYHQDYIYVFGGYSGQSVISSCERYSTCEDRWEFIGSLPFPNYNSNSIALESTKSIYLFGGRERYNRLYHTILRMELAKLTWEVLSVKLPTNWDMADCFKLNETQVYFVVNKQFSVFDSRLNTFRMIKPIDSFDRPYWPSYLFRGVLYKICGDFQIKSLELSCSE